MEKSKFSLWNSFVLLISFFISSMVFAQNEEIKLIIKDAENNSPIEDATVVILKTRQNLMSNVNGEVNFLLSGASVIQISHSSYVTKVIKSNTLKDFTILLKRNTQELEEVIIIKQPQKTLRKVIENSKEKLSLPASLKVYTREFFKKNGAYAYYNDGLLNFELNRKNKKVESNVLVEQNRAMGVMDQDVSDDLLGYNLNNLIENYYEFKYLDPILDESAKKQYDFLLRVYSKNKDYHEMVIKPLETSKGLMDEISIIYDPKKKLILEVVGELSQNALARNEGKIGSTPKNIYKSYYKNIYHTEGNYYYLLSSKEEVGFTSEKKKKKQDLEVRNYFITTKFSPQNFIYTEKDVFKDKTLFNKKDSVLTMYWNVSGLTATEEEQKIIESIETKTP